ncbi:hypothetical protein RJ55_02187 [Drechmeria coniospora]|nr:hypothetical protein RJ55_02187 [Drechmeria coniospora]
MKLTNALAFAGCALAAAVQHKSPNLDDSLKEVEVRIVKLGVDTKHFNDNRFYLASAVLIDTLHVTQQILKIHKHPPADAEFLKQFRTIKAELKAFFETIKGERSAIVQGHYCEGMYQELGHVGGEFDHLHREIVAIVPVPNVHIGESLVKEISEITRILEDIKSIFLPESCYGKPAYLSACEWLPDERRCKTPAQ